ncbi:MAG: PaaI family thioesterase [Terriglobia bacterium]
MEWSLVNGFVGATRPASVIKQPVKETYKYLIFCILMQNAKKSIQVQSKLRVTEKELKRVLSESAFARIYHFKLRSFSSGTCTLLVPFMKSMERPGGIVAGAIFMTAADVAMWLAIMTQLGSDAVSVTSEMTTAFLNPAREENVCCTASLLKLGKSRIYGVAECKNEAGRLLTHHTLTYALIHRGQKHKKN